MSLVGKTNEEKIYNYLLTKIKNPFGVAGLMGNLKAESNCRPTNLQQTYEKKLDFTDDTYTKAVDKGTYDNFIKDSAGYGLAQWTYWSRKKNLLNFAQSKNKSIGDLEMQLDFLWSELSTNYKHVLSVLKSAKSVLEASNVVLTKFERPANQGEAVQKKRASYGEEFYKQFVKTVEETPKEQPSYKVKIANCYYLNVRNKPNASSTSKKLRVLKKGDIVQIESTVNTGKSVWGKIAGKTEYINMYYTVKL